MEIGQRKVVGVAETLFPGILQLRYFPVNLQSLGSILLTLTLLTQSNTRVALELSVFNKPYVMGFLFSRTITFRLQVPHHTPYLPIIEQNSWQFYLVDFLSTNLRHVFCSLSTGSNQKVTTKEYRAILKNTYLRPTETRWHVRGGIGRDILQMLEVLGSPILGEETIYTWATVRWKPLV